jgi:hypothetical protein
MKRIFEARRFITVPDGTQVSAFLNATDVTHNLPPGLLGEMSIAAGRIGPRVHSRVHVLPVATQVTYVVAGRLNVRMKARKGRPYDLKLKANQAVVLEPGTLFQLRNDSRRIAEVLYLVSPSYVFEKEGKKVRYDDARIVSRTWEELEACQYDVPALKITAAKAGALRRASLRRLAARRRSRGQR